MARRLGNWLAGYRDFTEGTESPPIFHQWVGIGTLAGAAQRKLFMDAGYYQVHSNLYIILVSPPGRSRKTTALRIGKKLLQGVKDYGQEINFTTQASSVAALVRQFASIKNKAHQSLTAYSAELGSLLGTGSVEMIDFLVDIYDCNPDWDKQTVSRGLEKIENPWLNLMAATTPQWMGDNLSRTAVEGGFVSRSLFIYEDTRLRVAWPSLTEEQKKLQIDLKHDLAHIAGLSGEMKLSQEAKEFYTYWYENLLDKNSDGDYRLVGYYERKHIQTLKVAMAVSLAENDSRVIEARDIEAALELLAGIEPGMRRAFSAVGKNIYSTDIDRMREQLVRAGAEGITYKKFFTENAAALERDQFDKLLSTLHLLGEMTYDKATQRYYSVKFTQDGL